MMAIVDQYLSIKKVSLKSLKFQDTEMMIMSQKIGVTASTFAVRKQRNSFTDDEIKDILEVVSSPNEDVENYIMIEALRSRKNEPNLSTDECNKMAATW